MQVLSLKVGEKTYTTGRASAFLARKALEINKKTIEMAKKATVVKESGADLEAVGELMTQMSELNDLKSWLVCAVYGEKFSVEELESALTSEELTEEVKRVTNAIMGIIPKNA
ncbi:MAG: hypothetical protein VB078_00450 [Clostridiaceae bacterium]|nr:hypothetical protein [Clostridiaceae bacterium]